MSTVEFNKSLLSHETPIPGLVLFDLPVFGDNRGWFKENWQRDKMLKVGLPDFRPMQNNFSFNDKRGVARGIHAEPWDKYISLGRGKVFGFWVDIREDSETYGKTFTCELDPSKAIYVPAGVANGYQTLEDDTVYSYLVNDSWSADAPYAFVSMFDTTLDINWPIPLDECEVSDKDKAHPLLAQVTPLPAKKILVTGANGQLGRALRDALPRAEFVSRDEFDITSPDITSLRRWRDYSTIINAAAYTAVDAAETPEGSIAAWQANAQGVARLATIANDNNITLVTISSDYVFDGTQLIHSEDEALSPLSVYGQTKAAGDIATTVCSKHYIIRTSWVIGDGKNFVRTMQQLAERGIAPSVVDDQIGRPTFANDLAGSIVHLLKTHAPFGTYNVSNSGDSVSWATVAKAVFEYIGRDPSQITPASTAEYYSGKDGVAPRPLESTLKLDKIEATGFTPRNWRDALREYLVD